MSADHEGMDEWSQPLLRRSVFSPIDVRPPLGQDPCGAWVTIEVDHGEPSVKRWCDRVAGPCPFPGAILPNSSAGSSAADPVRFCQVRQATIAKGVRP